MTALNRVVHGRRVQVLLHARVLSRDYTVREWWDAVMSRRSRGLWPGRGPWPIFRYWNLGPVDVRVWTAEAMRRQESPREETP